MSDTVKVVIELDKKIYEHACDGIKKFVTPEMGVEIEKAVKKGVLLDDVKQEIRMVDFDFGDYYNHTLEIQDKVFEVLDNIGGK